MFAWENYQYVSVLEGKIKAQEINPSTGIQWIHTSSYYMGVPPDIQVFTGGVQVDLCYGNAIASCNVWKWLSDLGLLFHVVTQKFKFFGKPFWMYKKELLV